MCIVQMYTCDGACFYMFHFASLSNVDMSVVLVSEASVDFAVSVYFDKQRQHGRNTTNARRRKLVLIPRYK